MSTGRTPPPDSVPTLTEVVDWPGEVAEPVPGGPSASRDAAAPDRRASDDEVAERLLTQIQQQLDLAIDVRLREALAPVLARAADTLVRDARREMAATLGDLVARAVAAERARRKGS